MKAQHTAGPWKQGINYPERIIGGNKIIAYSGQLPDDGLVTEEEKANARLIAAAPELLTGCYAALAYLADPPSAYRDNREAAVEILRAAIAKAEGGEPM